MAKETKNKAGRRPPCFVLWDEDKMKKMKLSLAILMIQGIYYKRKKESFTKV